MVRARAERPAAVAAPNKVGVSMRIRAFQAGELTATTKVCSSMLATRTCGASAGGR